MPLNKPHELNDKHETKTKFKCNIDEKAIIFFKSKYLNNEDVIINKETKDNVRINEEKKNNDKQKVENIYLINPKMLSLRINPANNNEIEELDSLCTSGNQ